MVVAGVDGCKGGWLAARRSDTGEVSVEVLTSIGPLVDELRAGALTALAVDMPIGLPHTGPRQCDIEARRRLGPRRASVFPTPVRAVLGATTYEEACARSRAACGRALSRQAYNLLPRIADVDAVVNPDDQQLMVEAHPELAFALLAGSPLDAPKRTARGRDARLGALSGRGLVPPLSVPRGAALDDVLDAIALTEVAERVVAGVAERLGDATRDARGLRMEIVA